MRTNTPTTILGHGGIIALGIHAVTEGLRLDGPSALFPMALGVTLVGVAALSLLLSLRRAGGSGATTGATGTGTGPVDVRPGRIQAIGLILLAGYILAADVVGLLTAALAFLPLLAWLGGGERRVRLLAPVTIVFVAGLYVVFSVLLRLPLPRDLMVG
ncbi:tripartite tricarboxylate transporter TctB family protein [Roseospira visakhapatnamensis]|uniref:DUF1468 domain-containing protein n=1 Tax=Roseospira visakhapatnamensis TaxID=390880 RepID=A0A7W6RBT9_9PROT|nr:tripartite tricarboxylate transporter TctB family protein [Roseospira visakhapatnamensis]MBB4265645.1 hypothetical protein [Roseospira visakhapatnamensis]